MSANVANYKPRAKQPDAVLDSYTPEKYIQWTIQPDRPIKPGSIMITGRRTIYTSTTTKMAPGDLIYTDPKAGDHSLLRNITTRLGTRGVIETLDYYNQLQHMVGDATMFNESLATEDMKACANRCSNITQSQGYALGDSEGELSLTIVPLFCLNTMNRPMQPQETGDITIRILPPPAREYLFGPDLETRYPNATYTISDLELHWECVDVLPDDPSLKVPLTFSYYQSLQRVMNSNLNSIPCQISGNCTAVHFKTISVAQENDVTQSFLACPSPPGIPFSDPNGTVDPYYGFEVLRFILADNEDSLFTYQQISREEMMLNGLRSFTADASLPKAFSTDLYNPTGSDGYILGTPFGGVIDLGQRRLTIEMQSQISGAQWYCYLFFRCVAQLT